MTHSKDAILQKPTSTIGSEYGKLLTRSGVNEVRQLVPKGQIKVNGCFQYSQDYTGRSVISEFKRSAEGKMAKRPIERKWSTKRGWQVTEWPKV